MTQAANSSNGADQQAFTDAFSTKPDTMLRTGTVARENMLSAVAVLLAIVGMALVGAVGAHIVGSWVSLAGILVGLYAQLTSATTSERVVNVCAIGVAAVAFAFHLHHGGLF
jgi:hypothetical protein